MAYTQFFMDLATGSNLNAGSGAAGGGVLGSGAAIYTSPSGDWDGTSVFTPNDGSTPASSLTPNVDFLSVYPNGSTATPYIALITSITAGVNGPITCSTTNKFGTAPTSSSGTHNRSAKGGGAWADWGMFMAGVALTSGTTLVPCCFNMKANTYVNGVNGRVFSLSGIPSGPLWLRGYQNTPGDQDDNPAAVAGTHIPSFTFTTGGMQEGGFYHIYSGLDVVGASTANALWNGNGTNALYYRCRFRQQAGSTVRCMLVNGGTSLFGCRVEGITTQNLIVFFGSPSAMSFVGNYFTGGNTGIASTAPSSILFQGNIFDTIGGDVISTTTGTYRFIGNSVYNPVGHALNWSSTPATACEIMNNHFEGIPATKAILNNGSGTPSAFLRLIKNTNFNCANITLGQGDIPTTWDIATLSGSGFVNAAAKDFTASALLKAKGFPGGFEGMSLQGYMDTGAVQRFEPLPVGGIMIPAGLGGGLIR